MTIFRDAGILPNTVRLSDWVLGIRSRLLGERQLRIDRLTPVHFPRDSAALTENDRNRRRRFILEKTTMEVNGYDFCCGSRLFSFV